MFRFLHSSDLHLGKRFGNLPEDLRGRLREARHAVIGGLAARAREHGASTILLAGDSFDTETPSPPILRQAFAAMGAERDRRWIMLPGNHDSLLADELWTAARAAAPENVTLALEPKPILLEGAVILPAPCTARRPGRDLTEWMDGAQTADGTLRVGLAHGPIQTFSEEGGAAEVIAPDRAGRASLDYLALGDWHGQMRVGDRTWYSGAPEPDRFKHGEPGRALIIAVGGPGAVPEVSPVETGSFDWRTIDLELLSADEPASRLSALVAPIGSQRRQTLLRIVASGRTRPQGRSALVAAVEAMAPEFAHVEFRADGLVADCEAGDLDAIDRGGALRQAADALLAESGDESRPAAARAVSRDALLRLFALSEAVGR